MIDCAHNFTNNNMRRHTTISHGVHVQRSRLRLLKSAGAGEITRLKWLQPASQPPSPLPQHEVNR